MLVAKPLNCMMRLLWLKVFITSLLLGGAAAIVGVVVLLLFVVDQLRVLQLKQKKVELKSCSKRNCFKAALDQHVLLLEDRDTSSVYRNY